MNKKILIPTLKMNPATKSEFLDFLKIYKLGQDLKNIDFVVAAPFIYLEEAIKNGFIVAAQNCFYEDLGPYTGEISPLMLKNFGVKYVILGHSERRAIGENDEMIGKKLRATLRNGLIPILCVGETKDQKRAGESKDVLQKQIEGIFKNLNLESKDYFIIAYEPIWSISTNTDGEVDTPENASQMIEFINRVLLNLKLSDSNFSIIYGGSVNKNNVENFLKKENIKGALVGGASLKKDEFGELLRIADSSI